MIREIINFTEHLKENSSWIFEHKLEPSKGIHLFIETDEEGNHINWPPEKGKDWDYYDGKNMCPFLEKIKTYEKYGLRIGTTVNKVLDKKKQIFSCSPFIVSFKKQSFENEKLDGYGVEKISNLLNYFSENAISVCISKDDEIGKQKAILFKNILKTVLPKLHVLKIQKTNKDNIVEDINIAIEMKKDFYLNFYYKTDIETLRNAHENYLQQNLFNKADYNSDKELNPETYGLSNFYNGANQKKPFLEHKTATPYKGISSRIKARDTILLNDFDILLRRKVFPQPLPIFIDKNEIKNGDDIIKIFKDDEKLSYSQILKQLFEKDENITLKNYYLLFFNYKSELEDFDFVSKFEYKLENCKIQNLFKLKNKEKELLPDRNIHTIFGFESNILKNIFNNSLIRIDPKTNEYKVKYFDEIKAEFVSGGEPVYQMILKYRKAFYDYIYKSKRKALNSHIWDEIMWNNIIADLRLERDYGIKEKLNIWFSLYNFFNNNNLNRDNMASLIPELTDKMREVANNDNAHFENEKEFAFGAGQIVYFLLSKSASADKKHSLLEPFLQKVKAEQLQNAIGNIFATYKHEVDFGHGRFERLAKEVLAFDTNANLKNYQRFLLAGYFAPPVIFEKSDKETETTKQE